MKNTAKRIFCKIRWSCGFSLAAIFFLIIISNYFITKIEINNHPFLFYPPANPVVVFEKKLRTLFPDDQVLIGLFEGPNLFSKEFIDLLDNIVEQLEDHPLIDTVKTITNLDHISPTPDGFSVAPLLDSETIDREGHQEIRKKILKNRFALGLLVSEDMSAVAIEIRPQFTRNSTDRHKIETFFLETVKKHNLSKNLSAISGGMAQDLAEYKALVDDSKTLIPLTIIVGLFLIWFFFRRFLALFFAFISMVTTVSCTTSLYYFFGRPYTSVSDMIPSIISALTIAFIIHFFNGLVHASNLGKAGQDRVEFALSEIKTPSFYTMLTTFAGFASLSLSPVPPVRYFGIISAIGMIFVYVVVIYLLPPIIVKLDHGQWKKNGVGLFWIDNFLLKISRVGIRNAKWVICVFIIVILAGIPWIWKVQVETDVLKFFKETHPINVSTKKIQKKLSGITSLMIVFQTDKSDGLKKPENLNIINEIQEWAGSLPEVDKVISLVDFIQDMNWAFHSGDEKYRKIPDDHNLIAQYLFIYSGEDMYELVDYDFSITRVILNVNVHGAKRISQLVKQIQKHLEKQNIKSMKWHVAGAGRLFSDLVDLVLQGQLQSICGAIFLIFVIMLFCWRSFISSFVCMIPNFSPVLFTFILMGICNIWLDVATALFSSIVVGIAVDDTIHIYHNYRKRRKKGNGTIWALIKTYRTAGRAVTATTFVLVSQYLIFVFSSYSPSVNFGLFTAFGLMVALLFDLLLLPSLLVVFSNSNFLESVKNNIIIIRITAVLFIIGGMVHWLIIAGILKEKVPFLVEIYFHSLSVISPIVGIGIWRMKEWGRKMGIIVALTQLLAHSYMLYLDNFTEWYSCVSMWERFVDIALSVLFLLLFGSHNNEKNHPIQKNIAR